MRVIRVGEGGQDNFNVEDHLRVMTVDEGGQDHLVLICLLYTSPSPRDLSTSRMPSSA